MFLAELGNMQIPLCHMQLEMQLPLTLLGVSMKLFSGSSGSLGTTSSPATCTKFDT